MCPIRMACLERAIVIESTNGVYGVFGVWGGMSETERKHFRVHLREEGYGGEVPEGKEFLAAVRTFYNSEIYRKLNAS